MKVFFYVIVPGKYVLFSLMLDWWVPGWERYRMTRLLSEESEEKRQPLPTVLCMQIRCDIKCRVRDILPARHSLSDRRINSSHGNSFIFQGHRVPFFQVGCRRSVVERRGGRRIFPRPSLYFLLLVWLWKKEHTGK